ncbi:hypothetical protein Gotur_018782 [Gossypium turneri]
MEMALVGQMDSTLGMQRISLPSSLEVVLSDLGQQDQSILWILTGGKHRNRKY